MTKHLWVVATTPPNYKKIYSIMTAIMTIAIALIMINYWTLNHYAISAIILMTFFSAWCVVLSEAWWAMTSNRLATNLPINEVDQALRFYSYHKPRLETERQNKQRAAELKLHPIMPASDVAKRYEEMPPLNEPSVDEIVDNIKQVIDEGERLKDLEIELPDSPLLTDEQRLDYADKIVNPPKVVPETQKNWNI